MWKSFNQSKADPAFYLKVDLLDNKMHKKNQEYLFRYKVSVTNYVKLWSSEFDSNDIIKLMLDSNKNVEADGQKFLKVGLNMLNTPKLVERIEFTESSTGHLNIQLIRSHGIVFKMNFTLSLCCAEEFFDIITRPLLLVIDDQKKSETELRGLVEGMRKYLIKIRRESRTGDPLMQYEKLEIDEYSDERHMKDHDFMGELFGKDPEERVDPRHILYGRPLPALPYCTPLPIKEEADLTDAGPSLETSNTLIPTWGIKKEPTDSPISTESNVTTKIETQSNNNANDSNYNISNGGESRSNDGNSKTGVDANEVSNQLSRDYAPVTQSTNQLSPNSTDRRRASNEHELVKLGHHSDLENSPVRHLNSADTQPEHRPHVTPKKRRKNLNY